MKIDLEETMVRVFGDKGDKKAMEKKWNYRTRHPKTFDLFSTGQVVFHPRHWDEGEQVTSDEIEQCKKDCLETFGVEYPHFVMFMSENDPTPELVLSSISVEMIYAAVSSISWKIF